MLLLIGLTLFLQPGCFCLAYDLQKTVSCFAVMVDLACIHAILHLINSQYITVLQPL